MTNIKYTTTVLVPGLTRRVVIEGVNWIVRACNHEDLKDAEHNGRQVSEWAWTHARYDAYCINKNMHFYVTNNYIHDIAEIMGLI